METKEVTGWSMAARSLDLVGDAGALLLLWWSSRRDLRISDLLGAAIGWVSKKRRKGGLPEPLCVCRRDRGVYGGLRLSYGLKKATNAISRRRLSRREGEAGSNGLGSWIWSPAISKGW